ncbi:hypothetical protein K438DRAFT_1772558 [Mycena galopus ATCC 62051]|nr:hypothetical protein K438DRAFT_1772558 [Mycena galopus ATCC 62051]
MSLFRRLLTGCHLTTSYKMLLEPDQMHPLWWKLRGFTLLAKVLPFHLWTTATSIASLLVFMSTVMCVAARPQKFHFISLDHAVAEFEAVENNGKRFCTAKQIKHCNPALYAPANTWYSLHPSVLLGSGQWKSLMLASSETKTLGHQMPQKWLGQIHLAGLWMRS